MKKGLGSILKERGLKPIEVGQIKVNEVYQRKLEKELEEFLSERKRVEEIAKELTKHMVFYPISPSYSTC